jgi:regulatory protein
MSNKAYLYLIKLLSSRDYSEYKLREKLKTKGFIRDDIEAAIKEVIEKKYLKEDLYAEARIKGFMNKGYSQDYIQQKLKQEHLTVTTESIDEIYVDHQYSEDEQVRELVQKKLRGKPILDYDHEAKVIRFVLSKGHDYSVIKKMITEYKNQLENQ